MALPDEIRTSTEASVGGRSTARLATSGRPAECFVVMPFGKKPVPGVSDRIFDFDKPYRVIMRRAIEAAGMVPVRADESTASGIIHSDMFKALRDRRVVLAELSLHNPNVYYELGVRHVLASAGTVLMCRADQPLPFDIALSRVVYEYDGRHLDWEEAERVVPILRQYLLEALEGHQDSPVHGAASTFLRPTDAATVLTRTPTRSSSPSSIGTRGTSVSVGVRMIKLGSADEPITPAPHSGCGDRLLLLDR